MWFCFKMSYFVFKMQAQTFSNPHLDQTPSSLCPSGNNTWSICSFWSRKPSGGDSPNLVPGCVPFLHNWIRQHVRFCKVLEMYLSWQQRTCGSEGIHSSPALCLTGSCKTFHANIRFINAGWRNSGSTCGKQWTKMTTCRFWWILCKGGFVAINSLSPVGVVSDRLPINYCSKPEWKLMCGWDTQIERRRVGRGGQTACPACSCCTYGKNWSRSLP